MSNLANDTEVIVEEPYENYELEEEINEDIEIMASDDVYQCSSCNISFTDVNEHLQKYHGGEANQFKSETNDDAVILEESENESDEEEISLALIVKNDEGKYECNECTKSFKSYKRFVSHLKSHHNLTIEDFGALEQGLSNREKEYIEICHNGISLFRCNNCSATFDSRKSLLLHLSIHKNVEDAQKKVVVETKGNVNCQLCNKTFTNTLEFDLHIQAHDESKASTSNKLIPKKSNVIAQKGAHPCQYCEKVFKRPHEKVKHERIHSGLKPYSCDICGKKFRVTYCLSLHKRNVHSDDRPYICTFPGCNKRFKAQSVYNHHINTHSDERKFQCPFCPKNFKTSVQLAGHKNTHTKPFSCKICKRTFSSLYAVKNHMRTHGSEDSVLKLTCKICGAQYARGYALKDHMKTAHPEMEIEVEEYVIESDMEANNGDSELYSVVLSSENADN